MAKHRDIDWSLINSMSEEQKAQAYYTLAKRANQRMRDLEKAGHSSGAANKARKYLQEEQGRSTFKQSRTLSGIELKENLQALETFYTSKTATAKGIKELKKLHTNIFAEKGIHIVDEKKFYQFLSSQQFKTLRSYVDSEQLIEDFNNAMKPVTHEAKQGDTLATLAREHTTTVDNLRKLNDNLSDLNIDQPIPQGTLITIRGDFSIDTIIQQYDEFLNSEMTFEQVEEQRRKGGELLQ